MPRPILRNAQPGDTAGIVSVENQSWPAALAASAEQVAARIAAYPHGQWVAEVECRIVAVVWSQRITESFLTSNAVSYAQITDAGRFTKSHDPRGEIFQLIGVGVSPEARGLRLGRMLVDREIETARSLSNVRRIVGFTRPIGFHQQAGMALNDYVTLCGTTPAGARRPHVGFSCRGRCENRFHPPELSARRYGGGRKRGANRIPFNASHGKETVAEQAGNATDIEIPQASSWLKTLARFFVTSPLRPGRSAPIVERPAKHIDQIAADVDRHAPAAQAISAP